MENLKESERAASATNAGNKIGGAIDKFLAFISSVPFGIALLVILLTLAMLGMLIQQQELDTFANYFAGLTPSERLIYGRLGFFDIYHVWYFNYLLLLLSLNIILASIDYFPKAWRTMRQKKLTASPAFTQAMRIKHDPVEMPGESQASLVAKAQAAAKSLKFKTTVTEKDGRTTIYAEKGAWNRMGAYAVHVALLTIFTGGLLTARLSHTGGMWVQPGQKSDQITQNTFNLDQVGQRALELPFTVECIDIQQKLVDPQKFIDSGNTLDWLTRVKLTDKDTGKVTDNVLIHMNKPFDYRGYRFFQASFREMGGARSINLKILRENGQAEAYDLKMNAEVKTSDGSRVAYLDFAPHFELTPQGQPNNASPMYENPAAHLQVTSPSGERTDVWAFTDPYLKQIEGAPFLSKKLLPEKGPRFVLTGFEKASQAHMLSIQYDPGTFWFYLGSAELCLFLVLVFFFAHKRLWIVCEDGKVFLGGDANRNRIPFEDEIRRIALKIKGEDPAKDAA